MKKKIILLFSSIVTIHSFGQNNILKGKVFFLSSGNKPAVGVEVSGTIKGGLKANSVFTVDNGSFRLLFPNARDGMHIDLIVGNSDKNGTNIEVVNNKELETLCKIPADPTEEFGVIVCPKGGRDLAAQKYYKIIKTSTDIELKKIKTQFDRLLNQEKKDYQKIKELSEKIAVLEKHSDSLIIYKAALQIASINTDRASARVLNYLNLLNKGNLVQEAREALSIEKASTELNSAATGFENAIQELEIRAEASVSIFDFNDAVMCYDTIIKYSEKLNVDQVKIAYKYLAAGYISFDAGKYTEALNYQLKNEYIFRQHLDSNDLQLAISFNDIAATYLALGQFHKALRYEKKSITIREKSLPSMHPELAILYNNLGMIYEELGQYDEAFKYIRKSLEIDEPIYGSNSPKLEITYNNLAVLYLHTGEYEFALNLYKKLIATREIGREEKTPGNATTYNNIAEAYLSLGELSIAQDYQYKAIAIREEILGLKHPDLAVSYNNISQILLKQGNVKESLKYCDKSIQIFEGSFDSTHPLLATSYNNAALVHIDIGEYEKALSYQEKALDIQKKIFDSIHPALATSYNNLGLIYLEMDQYKTALLYQRKAIFLESKITLLISIK